MGLAWLKRHNRSDDGKYLTAWLSTRVLRGTRTQTALAWSLSLPQMAATLAAAVVAYNSVNTSGARLLDESHVNAILVVVTCVAGPILVEQLTARMKSEAQ